VPSLAPGAETRRRLAPLGPGEVVYDGAGFRTVPAPADARPRISREEAIAAAQAFPMAHGAEGPIEADLVLLTEADRPATVQDPYKYHRHLTWMITVHHAPNLCTMCRSRGAPTATAYIAVDATTRAVIENESIG
jgi:hypothetical protein